MRYAGVAGLLLGALLGLGSALTGAFIGALECTSETSSCVRGGADERWRGRVFDLGGHPAIAAPVVVDFGVAPSPIRLRTDTQGRFCFRWPRVLVSGTVELLGVGGVAAERDTRAARVAGGAPAGARAVLITPNGYLEAGGSLVADYEDWREADEPANCGSPPGPPWYQREGALGNWRSVLVIALGLFAFAVSIVGLVLRRRGLGRTLTVPALVLGVAAVVAFEIVWGSQA